MIFDKNLTLTISKPTKALRVFLFILLFASCSFHAIGQRDAAHWFFGNFAGLDFNFGNPILVEDGALDTTEGCSAISDKDTGELLFYTEGTTVWNRNHQIMSNGTGLLGSLSSTQSAVIVPRPGSDFLFYIFTTDEVQAYQNNGVGNGINYSIVSMNGDGGLGEVIEKNVNLLDNGSEKISVVETADGADFWIVTHFEDTFYSYLLDASGVSDTPVISTIGPNINDFENFRGAMKISPDGSKLAISHCLFEPSLGGIAYLYDFNNEDGTVSNELLIGDDLVYYGVEFSSDSSKLYFSGKTLDSQGQSDRIIIEQYDLNAPGIIGSRYVVLDYENNLLSDLAGAIQIAMNKKIYHALPGQSLSVINNPKLQGSLANFTQASLNLGFTSSSFGLPQYIQSFFESFVTIENTCEGEATTFIVDPNANVTTAQWDFGDPASGADNTSTAINPTHVFSAPGFYAVTVEFEFTDRVPKTFVEFVEIVPQLDVPNALNFDQCDIDGIDDGISAFNLIDFTNAALELEGVQYSFYNSFSDAQLSQDPITNATTYLNSSNGEVIYLVVGNDLSCNNIIEVTLNVSVNPQGSNFTYSLCDILLSKQDVWAQLQILGDHIIDGFPGNEDAIVEFYLTIDDIVNQTGELNLETVPHSLTEVGFLSVFYRVSNGADCVAIGEVTFDILRGVVEETDKIIDFCVSEGSIILAPDDVYLTYQWSTGETTPNITISEEGTYILEVVALTGCKGVIQFTVNEIGLFDVEILVNDFQQYNSIVITNSNPEVSLLYSINGGLSFQHSPVFDDLPAGYYEVVILGEADCDRIEELILLRGAPRYFTPNGDGTHDFWHVNNAVNYEGMVVKIFDRYGKRLYQMNNRDRGWDGTYGGKLMPSNAYWYRIEYEGAEYYGHFTLIRR